MQRPSSSPGCGHAHKVRPQPVTLTAQQHEEMSKLSSTQRIKPIPEGFGKFHVPDNSPLNFCFSPLKVEVQCQPQKRRN